MIQIGIIGPENANKKQMEMAEKLGEEIAKRGYALLTGGCGGVMEASSRGAKISGGITIGTPGQKRGTANKYIDIEICTPLERGNFIFAGMLSCDVVLVLPGDAGTSAEFYMGVRFKRPMVIIDASVEMLKWVDNKTIFNTKSWDKAVRLMDEIIKNDLKSQRVLEK